VAKIFTYFVSRICTSFYFAQNSAGKIYQGLSIRLGLKVGLGLLLPKHYLIFHSEFPKLLLYYSLRVDPLFKKWP